MSEEKQIPPLSGILAAMTSPLDELAAAAHDPIHLMELCNLIDDDGPDVHREGASLALAGLLANDERLIARFSHMIEDARVFGPYSRPHGASVYECRWIRGFLVGLVATFDPETARRVAGEREIPWPDDAIWPRGLPQTPGAAFVAITSNVDEKKVGVLGLAWLDAGILPEALAPRMRSALELLVEVGEEVAKKATKEE
jgi:hypothetical protein